MEKNRKEGPEPLKCRSWKIYTVVRLTLLMNIFFVFFSFGNGFSQKKVTMNLGETTIKEALVEFQRQTSKIVIYSDEHLAKNQRVVLNCKDVEIDECLRLILKGSGMTYRFEDDYILIIPLKTVAQDSNKVIAKIKISGIVKDAEGLPLPGVTVLLKGMKLGTSTNAKGEFTLEIPKVKDQEIRLVFSFIGMRTKEEIYKEKEQKAPWVIMLEEDVRQLGEVTVSTGYQTVNRKDMVGAYTTVKVTDIMQPVYTSVDQMLQGRVAGMIVMNTSSRVGTTPKIRIRGTSTILGNQDPLWVVDGIIQPDPLPIDQNDLMVNDLKNILGNQISWLNPADIETITVLKDASATAIYGSKAANGVIVITTKKGQADRMTINYNVNFNFRARPHYGLFNLMNSQERIQFSEEAYAANALYEDAPYPSTSTYEGIMALLYNKEISSDDATKAIHRLESVNTNWLKLLTRNSFSHNHNLSMSGGNAKVTYSASLGFNDQAGIEKKNNAKNLSGRLNIGVQVDPKVHVDVTLIGSINNTDSYAAGVDPMGYALSTSRAVPAYNEDGKYYFMPTKSEYSLNRTPEGLYLGYNILNELDHSYSQNKASSVSASLNFSWDLLPWLKYEFVGGLNNQASNSEAYAGEQTHYVAKNYRGYDFGTEMTGSERYNAAMLPFGGELYNSTRDILSWNIQNKIHIQKSFKEEHRINVLLGTEVTATDTKVRSNKIFGYVAERGEQVVMPTPKDQLKPIGSGTLDEWGILQQLYDGRGWDRTTSLNTQFSLFATLAYSYANRYVLNASIRNDASNRFGQDQNKRFDPTYSFGLSWNVAQESWMSSFSNILNQFNLRASYGIQGNAVNSISPDLILKQDMVKYYYGKYQSDIVRLPNSDLSWEKTKSWNFGLDVQLIQWITMNVEYYKKKSDDILSQSIALEYGMSATEINGGKVENSGVEYSLNITPIRGKDWGWTVGLNSSKNWNKAHTQSLDNFVLNEYCQELKVEIKC